MHSALLKWGVVHLCNRWQPRGCAIQSQPPSWCRAAPRPPGMPPGCAHLQLLQLPASWALPHRRCFSDVVASPLEDRLRRALNCSCNAAQGKLRPDSTFYNLQWTSLSHRNARLVDNSVYSATNAWRSLHRAVAWIAQDCLCCAPVSCAQCDGCAVLTLSMEARLCFRHCGGGLASRPWVLGSSCTAALKLTQYLE